jgi:SecD/SecF fusion protein
VGIITGTFSSIFIASPIFYYWHRGDRRLVEATEHKPNSYDWEEKES